MNKQKLDTDIKNNQCVILGTYWCGYTQKAFNSLKENNIKYKFIDTSENMGLLSQINKTQIPQIWINQKYIGGNDDLQNYLGKQTLLDKQKQSGGSKKSQTIYCSLCHSPNTNKSTCPYNPSAIKHKYSKHLFKIM
jgi:glutaredoxin